MNKRTVSFRNLNNLQFTILKSENVIMSKKSNSKKQKVYKKYSKAKRKMQNNTENHDVPPELIRIAEESGMKVSIKKTKIIASKIILDFANPLMKNLNTEKKIEESLHFSILAWNLGVLPPKTREKSIEESIQMLSFNDKKVKYLYKLIERKNTLFSKYNFSVRHYSISFYENGDLKLSVVIVNTDK